MLFRSDECSRRIGTVPQRESGRNMEMDEGHAYPSASVRKPDERPVVDLGVVYEIDDDAPVRTARFDAPHRT